MAGKKGSNLGNKNALGNKGGGRWSAYKELGAAKFLADVYFKPHSQEEIEALIRSGTFSLADRHILNAMEGDQKAIEAFTKKLFPDVQEVSGLEGRAIDLNVGIKSAINKTYGGGKSS